MSDRTETPPSAVGWYPDPYGLPMLRWWDGSHWSARTQEAPPPGGSPAAVPSARPEMPARAVEPAAPQPDQKAGNFDLAPPAPVGAAVPVPWAWGVAAAPVIALVVALIVAALLGPTATIATYFLVGVLVAAVVEFCMAYRDATVLEKRSSCVPETWQRGRCSALGLTCGPAP